MKYVIYSKRFNFITCLVVFFVSYEVHDHRVSHLKAANSAKNGLRGLSFGSTPNICQDVFKSAKLLYELDYVVSQTSGTVHQGTM